MQRGLWCRHHNKHNNDRTPVIAGGGFIGDLFPCGPCQHFPHGVIVHWPSPIGGLGRFPLVPLERAVPMAIIPQGPTNGEMVRMRMLY